MSAAKPKANFERLAELHEQHLRGNHSAASYDRAVREYFEALDEKAKLEAITAKKAKEQKRLAAKKRAMHERHRAMRAKIKTQDDAMAIEVASKHSELRAAAHNAVSARSTLDDAAEKLVLVHGSAPLE